MQNADPLDGSDRLYTPTAAAVELQRIAVALFEDPSDAPEQLLAALDDLDTSSIDSGREEADTEAEPK